MRAKKILGYKLVPGSWASTQFNRLLRHLKYWTPTEWSADESAVPDFSEYDLTILGDGADSALIDFIIGKGCEVMVVGTIPHHQTDDLQRHSSLVFGYYPEPVHSPHRWMKRPNWLGVNTPDSENLVVSPTMLQLARFWAPRRLIIDSVEAISMLHVVERRIALAAFAIIKQAGARDEAGLIEALAAHSDLVSAPLAYLALAPVTRVYPKVLNKGDNPPLVFDAFAVNQARWHEVERAVHEGTWVDPHNVHPYCAVDEVKAFVEAHARDAKNPGGAA